MINIAPSMREGLFISKHWPIRSIRYSLSADHHLCRQRWTNRLWWNVVRFYAVLLLLYGFILKNVLSPHFLITRAPPSGCFYCFLRQNYSDHGPLSRTPWRSWDPSTWSFWFITCLHPLHPGTDSQAIHAAKLSNKSSSKGSNWADTKRQDW